MSPRKEVGAHADRKLSRARSPRYRRGEPAIEQNRVKRSISDWRIALRIARRSVLRTFGTSAVVVTMVALPVAGFSAAALVGESTFPTADEKITAELGQNEARLYADYAPSPTLSQKPFDPRWVDYESDPETGAPVGEDPDASPVDPRTLFPSTTEFIELRETGVTTETAGGKGHISAVIGPIWGASFAGRTTITDGDAPADSTEVLASAAALERLGATVGSSVVILEPAPKTVTITGILADGMYPDDFEALYFEDAAWSDLDPSVVSQSWYLPDTEITKDDLDRLNTQGVTALSRAVLDDITPLEMNANDNFWMRYGVIVVLAGAFAVFEIVLLAGAAFAVGARKQQRSLATVASVGGGRRILYRIVTAQGLVLGFIGGIIGIAVGIPAGSAFMALTNDGSATQYWGYHLNPATMIAIALLAAAVGLLSAVAPARAATKFDVLAALRGGRKPPAPSRKAPVVGVVMLIAGVGFTLIGAVVVRFATSRAEWTLDATFWTGLVALVVGPILAQVGVISCGGLVLRSIAKAVSSRFGLGARLAARDSAAHPSRAVPAFAAIMVTAFIGVVVINMAVSSQRQSEIIYSHQIVPGEIQAWIPTDSTGEPTGNLSEVMSTLENTLDVESSAVIEGVTTVWDDDGNIASERTPLPSVPAENLCPTDPNSPDYDETFEKSTMTGYYIAQQDLSESDWRCASDQTQFIYGIGPTQIYQADEEQLALLLGKKPSAAAIETLESGGAVSLRREYVADDTVTIAWWSPETISSGQTVTLSPDALASETLPAIVDKPVVTLPFGLVISPATAERLGIETSPSAVLASLDSPPTQEQLDAANESLGELGSGMFYETGPDDSSVIWILGVLGLCGILFLGASTVAIGLARADGRQDDATLASVGATRMLRRNFAFWQAVIIVGVGVVTGAAAGLLTSYALSVLDTTGTLAFIPPWPVLAGLVVGMPLVIAAGSWLVASRPTTLSHRMSVG
ncbi:MAG: FtsX-like permease family protein [Mycetocola sp.]